MLTIHVTRPQDIRLESLADGPGLLPYKLGPTRLTTHYHSFIQYVQLNDIEDKINSVQDQLKTFKIRLNNETYILYEYQIDYLTNKLGKALNQVKSLEPSRAKRGLVDGLGSVIKSITGNLDYLDAMKYDEAIKTLQNNEKDIVVDLNNHISLNKEWMSQHSIVLEQLVTNQQKINETLESILKIETYGEYSLIRSVQFAQMLGIISNNVEELMLEIIRLENILAFIRTSSLHHSMIDIEVLKFMIVKLRKIYSRDRIPDLELREYYNLIKPGSYFVEKRIVIVYSFPIISEDIFELYKLSIVPNAEQLALIPSAPYVATNEKSFVYIAAECPKYNEIHLCEKNTAQQIRTEPDCIQELILHQNLKDTCQLSRIQLSREAIEKLDDQHYTLSLPRPTKVQSTCTRKDFDTLQGSYLVTIPMNCYIRTAELTISNDDNEIKGQPLKLSRVPYNQINRTTIYTHVKSKSIYLEDLHSIQSKISLEKPLEIQDNQPLALYHTTIPFYITASAVIMIIIFVVSRHHGFRHLTKKPTLQNHTSEDANTPKGEEFPATFSINMLK